MIVQCLLMNQSAQSIKYQNEIPSVGIRARACEYVIIAGDGYTAYFISEGNYKSNNALA